jgi:hypothetical protein
MIYPKLIILYVKAYCYPWDIILFISVYINCSKGWVSLWNLHKCADNVICWYPTLTSAFPVLSHAYSLFLPKLSSYCFHVYFKNPDAAYEKKKKKHDVCLCEPGLFHLPWWFLVPYVFWQMKFFCSLWVLLHHVYIPHFYYQFSVDVYISWFYNLAVVLTATTNMDSQLSLFQNTLI